MNKLMIYIAIGFIAVSTLGGIYYSWRKGIEREALLEYNQKQLEQNIRDQAEFRKKMEDIRKQQDKIVADNDADKKLFNDMIKNADDFLDSKETKDADRPASQVLKLTIIKLKDASK